VDIVRFGVGHRRPEGPRGSHNVAGQTIAGDGGGTISELAFGRGGAIEPHANPNASWFVVIEGGGFVRVGDEQSRVAAGEAVFWPPAVPHAAWTDQGHMRAILVEFMNEGRVIEGEARLTGGGDGVATPAQGRLTAGPNPRYDPSEGEPL
jgi:mannose-6-phosphate isomerase-like protein (cupin superfamily)